MIKQHSEDVKTCENNEEGGGGCVSVLCLSSWLEMHLAEVVHKACTLMDTGRTFQRRAATISCKYLSQRVPQRPPVNRLLLLCRLPYASSLDLQYFHSHQSLPSMSPAPHVNCTSLSFSCSPFSYLSSLPHLLRCSLIANAKPPPFPFAPAQHSDDNERSLVFPGRLLLYHATTLCLASSLTFMFSIRHSSDEPCALPP